MTKKSASPKKVDGGTEIGNPHLFDLAAFKAEKEALEAKYLAGVREEITQLQEQRRTIDTRLNELNRLESEITGHAYRLPAAGKNRRPRTSTEDKLAVAKVLFDKMHGSKLNKFRGVDLKDFSDGMPVAALVALWNESAAVKDDKTKAIHSEGEKGGKAYWVA
jgi:hypothetical protein